MPNKSLPILVVDDTKFSSAVIGRTLKNAEYTDVRFASSAAEGLRMLEERHCSILLADWLMTEMDGLELTAKVRQIDEASNHYTYVILLTAKEGVGALSEAFDRGVDDFINKSVMNEQLLPRIYAASRITCMQNRLLEENGLLISTNNELKDQNLIDPLTGLGNLKFGMGILTDTLAQVESRGGAVCLLVIGIANLETVKAEFNDEVCDQLRVGIGRRLRQMIRPLDTLVRLNEDAFGLITYQATLEHCTAMSFRRIFEGINLKAFKTYKGFVSVDAGLCISAADNTAEIPSAEQLLETAYEKQDYAHQTGVIAITHWPDYK